jgi:8-oxo-dGTP pyrophosphatase MutT (NUDIX family)
MVDFLIRLQQQLAAAPSPPLLSSKGRIPAAVLIVIVATEQPYFILTERRADLKNHPGQISFPGGGVEITDRDILHTALREAEEEIGLDPSLVQVLGYLPELHTLSSAYVVTPVVASLQAPPTLLINPQEVTSLIELPLTAIVPTSLFQTETWRVEQTSRTSYTLYHQNKTIWGLTAMMLHQLASMLDHPH